MIKFIPKLYKVYKTFENSTITYKIFYRFDSKTDVYYFLVIGGKYHDISTSHEFAKFLALRNDDYKDGKLNREIKHELLHYMFQLGGFSWD